MAILDSVNVGRPVPNPYKETRATGITKVAQSEAVQVRDSRWVTEECGCSTGRRNPRDDERPRPRGGGRGLWWVGAGQLSALPAFQSSQLIAQS